MIDVLVGHVPRRHGGLPRRPHVRHAPAGRRGSRPTRRVEGLAVRDRWGRRSPSGAPGSTRTGSGGWNALLLGVVVGLAAPLGDLFESKIKRDAGTKDAGTLFGAHGGALDRLDAALFTLVAGYYVWLAAAMSTSDQTSHVEPGPDDRGKEERKRDRQMIELLNELRVALPGVQILFAFLLTVPFSMRFETLTAFQRDVYYVTLMADGALGRVPDRAVGRAPAALPPGRARAGSSSPPTS